MSDIYQRAGEVLADRGWTQGRFIAYDGSVCLARAIDVASNRDGEAYDMALFRLNSLLPDGFDSVGVAWWNDQPERTYEDVQLLLKQASEKWGDQEEADDVAV